MSLDNDYLVSTINQRHLIGRVKWFNTKAGYGFITVTDGEQAGTDVFVHHSDINVVNQQYKYLVQGEYVDFHLTKVESEKYMWQASKVSGIKGGKLMCETRHELKIARNEYKSTKQSESDVPKMPVQKQMGVNRVRNSARIRGEGPRDSDNKKEWTLVESKKSNTRQQRNSKPKMGTPNQGSTIITIQSK